jgi:hypothetical protein
VALPVPFHTAPTGQKIPGRARSLAIAGDRLAADANPLALPMELRQHGHALDLAALRASGKATGKVLLLVHGLCMNDLQWQRAGHDHGAHLAQALGYTPVYLRYNTGQHTSTNGQALAERLEALLQDWPVPVQELSVLAHSMGGLVVRAACHSAATAGQHWPAALRHMVFLGTPHHGAPLERAGHWVDVLLDSTHEQANPSFQAEVAQLLHLVTHSLYSNQEIFLRELISNASDACDKLRFEALNNAALYEDAPNLEVRVSFDKAAKTLTITDNGIGMSAQEAIDHLGTIAKSGTKDFMGKLSGDQKADAQLIGQFGVGFYSGFIVADKITVESRRAGLKPEEGVRWTAAARATSRWKPSPAPQRGTSVILHLRDDAEEYLNAWKLKQVIGKYSDHISLPILMEKEEWKDGEKPQRRKRRARRHGQDRRVGNRQQGQRPVDAPQEGHHRRAVRRVLQDHQPRPRGAPDLGAQPRGRQHRVHAAAVHPRQGAVRPVEPRQEGGRQAVRQARLHHGRRRGADAHLPALRQGRDRLGRPAAEREPRAAAGKPRRALHPRRQHQARAEHAGRPGQARQARRHLPKAPTA